MFFNGCLDCAMFFTGWFGTSYPQSQVPSSHELHEYWLVSWVARRSALVSQPEIPQWSWSVNGNNVIDSAYSL